jgi:hypothetical protein
MRGWPHPGSSEGRLQAMPGSSKERRAIAWGDPAPPVELWTPFGVEVSLQSLLAESCVVL